MIKIENKRKMEKKADFGSFFILIFCDFFVENSIN